MLNRSGRGLASAFLLVLSLHVWALAEWAGAGEQRALPGSPVTGLFRVLQLMPATSDASPALSQAQGGPVSELGDDGADPGRGPPAMNGVESSAPGALGGPAAVDASTSAGGTLGAAPGTSADASATVASTGVSDSHSAAGLRQETDAAPAPDVLMLDGQAYWPSRALQRTPLPSSSPDLTLLRGVATSGLPVQLRVFIDAQGVVREVVTLQAGEIDAAFVDRLRQMFLHTRFVPGARAGQPVAGYRDLEFSITAVHE